MNKEGYKDPTAETAIANMEKPWREVTYEERVRQKRKSADSADMLCVAAYQLVILMPLPVITWSRLVTAEGAVQ